MQSVYNDKIKRLNEICNSYIKAYNKHFSKLQTVLNFNSQYVSRVNDYLVNVFKALNNYSNIGMNSRNGSVIQNNKTDKNSLLNTMNKDTSGKKERGLSGFNRFFAMIDSTDENFQGFFTSEAKEYLAYMKERRAKIKGAKSDGIYTRKIKNKAKIVVETLFTNPEMEYADSKVQDYLNSLGKVGGAYGELCSIRKESDYKVKLPGRKKEYGIGDFVAIHHIPPKSVIRFMDMAFNFKTGRFNKKYDWSICIAMSSVDHKKTASYGRGLKAYAWGVKQLHLILKGDFKQALKNEVEDIQKNFGHKYDRQLEQAVAYFQHLYNMDLNTIINSGNYVKID